MMTAGEREEMALLREKVLCLEAILKNMTTTAQQINGLSFMETRLVATLAKRPGEWFDTEAIYSALYWDRDPPGTNTIQVFAKYIRAKRPDILVSGRKRIGGYTISLPIPVDVLEAMEKPCGKLNH